MAANLKKIGGFLLGYGLISVALYFFNMSLVIFFFLDFWGSTVSLILRIVITLLGGILWVAGSIVEGYKAN